MEIAVLPQLSLVDVQESLLRPDDAAGTAHPDVGYRLQHRSPLALLPRALFAQLVTKERMRLEEVGL